MLLLSLPLGSEGLLLLLVLALIIGPALITIKVIKKPFTIGRILLFSLIWLILWSIIGSLFN